MDDFIRFLNSQLNERGWSISELARRANVSQSLASDVINGKIAASERFCLRAAQALDVPGENMLRLAGYLIPQPAPVAEENEILDLVRKIPKEDRRSLLRALRGLASEAPPPPISPGPAPDQPAKERTEEKADLLGPRAFDENEIVVHQLDALYPLATVEVLEDLANYYYTLAKIKRRLQDVTNQPKQSGGTGHEEARGVSENTSLDAISDAKRGR